MPATLSDAIPATGLALHARPGPRITTPRTHQSRREDRQTAPDRITPTMSTTSPPEALAFRHR
ncbi:hypothetical protein RYX36_001968 [Vicia faba]